jgi:radical SAM superfamily enzyme YgiQ (UPF0313 family)
MRVSLLQFDGATTLRCLPLAAGLLAATVKADPELGREVSLLLETRRLDLTRTLDHLDRPDVVALSAYAWNLRYALAVARGAKERWPAALVVMGGPSVPRRRHAASAFLREHGAIDVLAFGEGEITFRELLRAIHRDQPLGGCGGIAFRERSDVVFTAPRARMEDLSVSASPYLGGTFETMLRERDDLRTSALVETNRGCPFACTFCDWGQAINGRVHELPLDRVLAELRWISGHGIPYLYIVDANFGIRPRDQAIVDAICDLKRETGLPHFVYFHLTKNAHRSNLRTIEALREASIGSQVALSMQDFDPTVLRAIQRDNISVRQSLALREVCAERRLPTFNELLLGLPMQTLAGFKRSVIAALTPFPGDTFYLYLVRLLENAELASPEQRERFALETRRCRVVGRVDAEGEDDVVEDEEVVVGSASMSVDQWRQAYDFGYTVAACHNMLLLDVVERWIREQGIALGLWFDALLEGVAAAADGSVLARWRHELERFTASILEGGPLLLASDSVPALDPTQRREPTDVLTVVALSDLDRFHAEVSALTESLLGPSEELAEVFRFQRLLTPGPGEREPREAHFERDWAAFTAHPGPRPPLDRRSTTLRRSVPPWPADGDAFYQSYLAMAYSKSGRPGVRSDPGVADPHALVRREVTG